MKNIAIFEDHPIVANSLKLTINAMPNCNLIFIAKTKSELYTKLREYNNLEIIIVDVIANDVSGLEIYEHLNVNYPLTKVISYTTLSSPVLVENLLANGVKGYVNKNQEVEDLIDAINKVANNEIYLPEDYSFLSKKYEINKSIILTDREIEIMQFIIKEYTTIDIASLLKISVSTIESHRKSIFAKLNVKNVAGMVREASKLGFIN